MRWLVVGALVASAGTARADEKALLRWPDVPADHAEPLGDQMLEHLDYIGDQLGVGLEAMSGQLLTLHVDSRHDRMQLGLGRDGTHLTLRLESSWLFEHGAAHIHATLHLGIGSHLVSLKLPGMELQPDSYHGQDMVVFNVHFLERSF